jgi:hypothetical protein
MNFSSINFRAAVHLSQSDIVMCSVSVNNVDCSFVFVVELFNILYSCSHPELYLFYLYIAVT